MGEVYRARDTKLGSRGRPQGRLGRLRPRSRADRPVSARSAPPRRAESSAHRRHLRPRRRQRRAVPHSRARRRRHARRSIEGGPAAARGGGGDRAANRGCPPSRAREGDHPPRPQAVEYRPHARRTGEGAGLRPRQSARTGSSERDAGPPAVTDRLADDHVAVDDDRRRHDPGHGGVHGAGAGQRARGGQAV